MKFWIQFKFLYFLNIVFLQNIQIDNNESFLKDHVNQENELNNSDNDSIGSNQSNKSNQSNQSIQNNDIDEENVQKLKF